MASRAPQTKTVNQAIVDIREADNKLRIVVEKRDEAKRPDILDHEAIAARKELECCQHELQLAIIGDDACWYFPRT